MSNKNYQQPVLRSGSYCGKDRIRMSESTMGEKTREKSVDHRFFSDSSYPTKVVKSEVIGYVAK